MQLQLFELTQRKPLRTHVKPNGEVWFVAKDVAEMLGIEWKGKHTINFLEDDERGVRNYGTPSSPSDGRGGGEQSLTIISESGMYKLAFRSNKEEAKQFTSWVTKEVLPAIRRGGSYSKHSKVSYSGRYGGVLKQIKDRLMHGDISKMHRELVLDRKSVRAYVNGKVQKPRKEVVAAMLEWLDKRDGFHAVEEMQMLNKKTNGYAQPYILK